jgi:AraC family transcriptional regulator of adaptative response / DNA-3-methyladenine glycosylase II
MTRPQGLSGLSGLDDEQQYQAALSKDARFDGVFFIAVSSTGIYCRPSCPAITPKRAHMRYYRTAAAAQEAGYRACKRCRPDASPGSPEWNIRADVVGRAMRLIADGVVDRDGVAGLASRLGYEQRQVRRLITAELGAGPLAIARAQRAQTARVLTETTALPVSEIAFASGFTSIRQFNATILEVFAVTPTQLRESRGRRRQVPRSRRAIGVARSLSDPAAPGLIRLRLPYRAPIDMERMIGFLAARAIPGVEVVEDGRYRRTMLLPNGSGILSVGPSDGYVDCELQLEDLRDLTAAVQRCRRLLDLDADPSAVTAAWLPRERCWGRWPWPTRVAGCPVTWTGTSSRCGPSSASRCRWPRPGASGRGWWPPTASRSSARRAR